MKCTLNIMYSTWIEILISPTPLFGYVIEIALGGIYDTADTGLLSHQPQSVVMKLKFGFDQSTG